MRIEHTVSTQTLGERYGTGATTQTARASEQKMDDKIELSMSMSGLDTLPDLRMDRIETARARIKSGFYDRPEVREGIAEAFLKIQVA
ncbi:MAG: anti-sigma28 factor (negative regulator of flagellin synthesis) [Candidatus Latescibacterota bacterium]|jgi:anti-sigma28 factor (negative regulator of flagellin synthesis)